MTHDPLCPNERQKNWATCWTCWVISKICDDQFEYKGDIDTAYGQGWDEGLDAAREAVTALENVGGYQPSDFYHIREDVIDAIDALREEQK